MELSDAREKSPATPGIDPGTFRLVAQCLNHYATPGPGLLGSCGKFLTPFIVIVNMGVMLKYNMY